MNVFRPIISHTMKKSMAGGFARFASTPAAIPVLSKIGSHQKWFSDPSTYPLIVIIGCTYLFAVRMGMHALLTYKDVEVDPKKRNSVLQTWGHEERPHLVKKWVEWNAYPLEGLGIDHNEWKMEHNKPYVQKWREEHNTM